MFDLVVNLSRTSREVGSVAGDLANLRPECRHMIFTPSDVITWFYKPKPSHDVKTNRTLLETYYFGGSSSTTSQLVRNCSILEMNPRSGSAYIGSYMYLIEWDNNNLKLEQE
jgi:hypothetical protein